MKKPWSISTTVRNPQRLRELLSVLRELEGTQWDAATQREYQILLIRRRLYGYGSPQFYSGLPNDMVKHINDLGREISAAEGEKIFNAKNYEDPAMRGRQSFNPLKKFGLASVRDGLITITPSGESLLREECDLGDALFRIFLKWQIPNPLSKDYAVKDGYDIKPFLGTLHLIHAVNQKEKARGNNPTGLSRKEFSLFVPTLVHHADIDAATEEIIAVRDAIRKAADKTTAWQAYRKMFAARFLSTPGWRADCQTAEKPQGLRRQHHPLLPPDAPPPPARQRVSCGFGAEQGGGNCRAARQRQRAVHPI